MAVLRIEKFSCLEFANVELRKCTIMIGPQASGKSVISKLFYFFNDIVFVDLFRETEIVNISSFQDHLIDDFKNWFPPSAWGKSKFKIEFSAGPISVTISRARMRGKSTDNIKVSFSKTFEDRFDMLRASLARAENEFQAKDNEDEFSFRRFDMIHQVQEQFRKGFQKDLGDDYIEWQLFIPAGRSFFTSLGKAISAFERSGMLDPITMRFGEYYLSAKNRMNGRTLYYPRPKIDHQLKEAMRDFFGGEIVTKKDIDFVESADGRLIPVSYLSSGQQELLPLWISVEQSTLFRAESSNIFIEEPEAHIFPSTQSALVEYLSRFIIRRTDKTKMMMTTHSPYVLAKFNNLIKAGIVGSLKGKANKVSEIVPRSAWLSPHSVAAYSIESGHVKSITDEEGLIDANFLDEVSGTIASEYMALVDIECSA